MSLDKYYKKLILQEIYVDFVTFPLQIKLIKDFSEKAAETKIKLLSIWFESI